MSDFTPGPWTTDGIDIEAPDDVVVTYADDSRPSLATVWGQPFERRRKNGRITSGDPKANARLIAAAPALFGRLVERVKFCRCQDDADFVGTKTAYGVRCGECLSDIKALKTAGWE